MTDLTFRTARAEDAAFLNRALAQLSADIGDSHQATTEDLRAALAGARPPFEAILALSDETPAGAVVFSPVYSTIRAAAGLFVSDLWVAEAHRSQGLGRRLLAQARDRAAALWQARYMKLNVYADNAAARAAYDRMGFVHNSADQSLFLEGAALAALPQRGGTSGR